MFRSAALWCAVVLLFSLTSCNRQSQQTAQQEAKAPAATPAAVETAAPATGPAATGAIKKGKVAETMNSGGYSYILVDDGTEKTWVAVLKSEVAVGQEISYYDGMVMQNFTSKTLNRTFDRIVFSNGIVGPDTGSQPAPVEAAGAAPAAPAVAAAPAAPAASSDSFAEALKKEGQGVAGQAPVMAAPGSKKAVVPFAEIHVEKAKGDDAYTVGEIYKNGASLAGKKVQVRGKVVKISPNIMGLNWIHLQDGTGDPKENSHDLVVTSSAMPKEGSEVITVKGIVAAHKDFGAGYVYDVILEQAEISQ